jgi:hypothetical protein
VLNTLENKSNPSVEEINLVEQVVLAKKDAVLNFANILDDQFRQIGHRFKISIDTLWDLCKYLDKCHCSSINSQCGGSPGKLAVTRGCYFSRLLVGAL